jgi:hypothetical protein
MKIEVVLRKIGKDRYPEPNSVNPLELQRVGRNLHYDIGTTGFDALSKNRLQIKRLRGGSGSRQDALSNLIGNRADQTGALSRSFQKMLD